MSETEASKTIQHKKGYMILNNTYTAILLRHIADSYHKEIIFENKLKDQYLSGEIPENTDFTTIISLLQSSGVRVKQVGENMIAGGK